jgi:hypothetical protein
MLKRSVKTPTVIAATAALVFAGAAMALDFSFTSHDDPDAPKIEPFQLPTFDGRAGATNDYIEPLVEAPRVDADAIYAATLNCYPGASTWHVDVNLEAGFRTRGAVGLDDTGIGGHYVGIVARMPLYSVSELEREQAREAQRRAETAALVGQYIAALNKRNTAHRELGLYSALESRSQVRVQLGVIDATEQVGYLEKVIGAYDQIHTQEAAITEKRLALTGLCRDNARDVLDRYLRKVSALPKHPCNSELFEGNSASEYQKCLATNGASLRKTVKK